MKAGRIQACPIDNDGPIVWVVIAASGTIVRVLSTEKLAKLWLDCYRKASSL